MFAHILMKRSLFTTIPCFKSELVSKNVNIPGYGIRSGYILYVSENMKDFKGSGDAAPKIKEISEKWRNESNVVKELYSKKASIMNKEIKEKFENLSQDEKDKLIEEAQSRLEKRKVRKEKAVKKEKQNKLAKAIGMEKPTSAYSQFVKEYWQNKPNCKIGSEISAEISSMWKNLPDEEKKERIQKHKEEFAKWNMKKNEYLKTLDNE